MGFMDNFKAAMQRGAEAANAYNERERAKQQAATPLAGKPQPRPTPRAAGNHTLPEGVFMVQLDQMEPIDVGTNAKGQNVVLKVSGVINAKSTSETTMDKNAQREAVIKIVRNCIHKNMVSQVGNATDFKYFLRAGTHMNPIVIQELKASGFDAVFKIPLIIRPL